MSARPAIVSAVCLGRKGERRARASWRRARGSARCMFSSGRSFAHFHEEADTPLATTTAAVELSVATENDRSFERAAQPTQGNVSLHGQNREPLRCCVIWSVPVICGFAIGSAVSLWMHLTSNPLPQAPSPSMPLASNLPAQAPSPSMQRASQFPPQATASPQQHHRKQHHSPPSPYAPPPSCPPPPPPSASPPPTTPPRSPPGFPPRSPPSPVPHPPPPVPVISPRIQPPGPPPPAPPLPANRHTSVLTRQRYGATGVSAAAWDAYILSVYHAQGNQLASLPRFDQVDLVYDHLLSVGEVNNDEFPGRCNNFRKRPFRSGRAPHSPLVAWFYRAPPFSPITSNTWVEITHCAGSDFEAHASWYYVVRGSGIFVNTGSTISFGSHGDAVNHFLGGGVCNDQQCNDAIQARLPEAARAAGIDSIQFLHHCDFDCDEPANDNPPGRGNGNGCGHELMVIQKTSDGSALGTGGNLACPTGVQFRSGVDGSLPCECVDTVPNVEQLRSQRGTCTACHGSSMLQGFG